MRPVLDNRPSLFVGDELRGRGECVVELTDCTVLCSGRCCGKNVKI